MARWEMQVWVVHAASVEYNDNDHSVDRYGPCVGVYDRQEDAAAAARAAIEDVATGWDPYDISGAEDEDDVWNMVQDATSVTVFDVRGAQGACDHVWAVTDQDYNVVVAAFAHGPDAAAYLRDECYRESPDLTWRLVLHEVEVREQQPKTQDVREVRQ